MYSMYLYTKSYSYVYIGLDSLSLSVCVLYSWRVRILCTSTQGCVLYVFVHQCVLYTRWTCRRRHDRCTQRDC
jgi:hypothetical protein